MKLKSVTAAYFSPAGTTEKTARHLATALAQEVKACDLGAQELKEYSFDQEACVIVAVPVYSGRAPARAIEALKLLHGNGAACISVAVYGNRAAEDTLVELNDSLAGQGFRVVASIESVAQHSLVADIATGRPDAADRGVLDGFAAEILKRLEAGQPYSSPEVPGNRPYKEVQPGALTPMVLDSCTDCGQCVQACPVSAIPADDCRSTQAGVCILCTRCIKVCPAGARILPPPYVEKVTEFLRPFSARQEAKLYL